jgi:predicted DNA binding CopG/RHH family protein
MNDKTIEFLDEEEKDLYEAVEKQQTESLKEDLQHYFQIAKNTVEKNCRINLRMNEKDLRKIREKSIELGVPYQTLINMILHKFANKPNR